MIYSCLPLSIYTDLFIQIDSRLSACLDGFLAGRCLILLQIQIIPKLTNLLSM